MGGIARSLMSFNFYDVLMRFKVLAGAETDPYALTNTYMTYIHGTALVLIIMLFADYGGDDNNISVAHKTFHKAFAEP